MIGTMLERMDDRHIFWIEDRGEMLEIGEACDGHYSDTLTRDELRRLGEELIALSERRYTITDKGREMLGEVE